MDEDLEPLLSDKDLERIFKRSQSRWQKDRLKGGHNTIPFIKIGGLIRYKPADVRAYLMAQRRRSTSDAGAIHYTQLTDAEIDAKAAELRKMGAAHYAHADELNRWKTDPRRKAAADDAGD